MEAQVLKDKVAIVTGASKGLGEGIARRMAQEGAITILLSRHLEDLKKVEADILRKGGRVASCAADVADAASVNKTVKDVIKAYGKVDILVNDAAIAFSTPFLDITDEARDRVIDINIKGVWNCTRAVLPSMLERKYGKIINISSITGPMVSSFGMTIYAASKGAVSGFTKSLALEVADKGINVNAILPGSFDTPMVRNMAKIRGFPSEDEYVVTVGKEIPIGRLGYPREIGDLAVFLASDYSTYIMGADIVIDGANSLQEFKKRKTN